MQRRHFIRSASLAAASTLLLGSETFARTIVLAPPVVDLTPYGGREIHTVLMNFTTAAPTMTFRAHTVPTDLSSLPLILWQVPVSGPTAFLEAGRYLQLGHFGMVFAQGSTLSFVYSCAQHEVTLVVPSVN